MFRSSLPRCFVPWVAERRRPCSAAPSRADCVARWKRRPPRCFPSTRAFGRSAPLAAWRACGGSRGCKNVGWIRQGIRHLYVNHIITPTAEGATGTVDMLMIGIGGDPNKIEHDGFYEDTYVKTAQGWRFKERIHHVQQAGNQQAQPAAPAAAPGSAPGTGAR